MKTVLIGSCTLASCAITAAAGTRQQLCMDQYCRRYIDVKSTSLVQSVSFIAESQKDILQTPAEAAATKSVNISSGPRTQHLQTQRAEVLSSNPAKSLLDGKPRGRIDVTENEGVEWRVLTILSVLTIIAISPILYTEGKIAFAVVIIYLVCLTLVKIWVKEAMSLGLTCPDSITAIHMISTAVAALILERPRKQEALAVLPISLVSGCSLLLNNTSLLYGGVAFVSMISCTCPIFTFVLDVARSKRSLELYSFPPVLLVVLGAMLCVQGEQTAAIVPFLLSAGATFFRATKSVWQQDLLTVKVSPLRLVFWSAFWSFLLMIPIVIVNEGTKGITEFSHLSNQGRTSFLLSIAAACIVNISQCFAVKLLGSVMQSVVGNLNLILIIVLSQAWLHESVSMWQYAGVVLLVAGTVLNKMAPRENKMPAEKTVLQGRYRSAGG